tara:strand:+ start:4341 stop:5180 length:840 start_codon:yes stop_codon:yes gene_type:complete
MNKLAIIDADSLCYICSKDTIKESIDAVDFLFANIIRETGSTHYYLFLSEGKYFRHNIDSDYKGNRKATDLKFVRTLKAYLKENYYAESFKLLEADDIVAYVSKLAAAGTLVENEDFTDNTICAIDKDVSGQIEGSHFNYSKGTWKSTTQLQAHRFLFTQSITGDAGDNIKGVPGVGAKKAEEYLKGVLPEKLVSRSIKAYKIYEEITYPKKQANVITANSKLPVGDANRKPELPNLPKNWAVDNYVKNFRLVYLLRDADRIKSECGYIPNIKAPIEIK